MTPQQIALVQETFMQFAPNAATVAEQFYARLFTLDPALRPLFTSDKHLQHDRLLTMLVIAVRGLPHFELLQPTFQALGRRHIQYGVVEAHYDTAYAALLWALERQLGQCWTTKVAEAWSAAYALLADVMRAAAFNHDTTDESSEGAFQ